VRERERGDRERERVAERGGEIEREIRKSGLLVTLTTDQKSEYLPHDF
jgi:hypothetical protein